MTWTVKMPDLGPTVFRSRVAAIFVKEGDVLKGDQPYMEIDPDKISVEIPIPFHCVVKMVIVKVGDIILKGSPVLIVEIDPHEEMSMLSKKENITNIIAGLDWITSQTHDQLGLEANESVYSFHEFLPFVDDTVRIASHFKEFPISEILKKDGASAIIEDLRASLFDITEIFGRLEKFNWPLQEATRTDYLQTVLFVRRRRKIALQYFFESFEKACQKLELQLPIARREISELKGQVLIIYGRKGEMAEDAERFVRELGLDPVILSGQTQQEHNNAGDYAIILLTLDDFMDNVNIRTEQAKARQNVILELGFSLGRLGSSRVTVLCDKDLKSSLDYRRVGYIPMTHSDEWKESLVAGLQAAGFEVNTSALR